MHEGLASGLFFKHTWAKIMSITEGTLGHSLTIGLDQFVSAANEAKDGQKLTISGNEVVTREANSAIGGKLVSWIKTNISGDQDKALDQWMFRLALTDKYGTAGEKAYQAACGAHGFSADGKAHSLTADQVKTALDAIENPLKYEKAPKTDQEKAIRQNKEIIHHFKNNGDDLLTQGLARVPGNTGVVNAVIQERALNGDKGREANNGNAPDANDLASAFKKNFRENISMKDSDKMRDFVEAYKADNNNLPNFSDLPEIVQDAVTFAKMIAVHSDVNLMPPANLATCFAPNMIQSGPVGTMADIADTPIRNEFFTAMINKPVS